jgi:hypothetical protein
MRFLAGTSYVVIVLACGGSAQAAPRDFTVMPEYFALEESRARPLIIRLARSDEYGRLAPRPQDHAQPFELQLQARVPGTKGAWEVTLGRLLHDRYDDRYTNRFPGPSSRLEHSGRIFAPTGRPKTRITFTHRF